MQIHIPITIGDIVFFLHENEIKRGQIEEIDLKLWKSHEGEKSYFDCKICVFSKKDNDYIRRPISNVFLTKEALIKTLTEIDTL